MSYSNYDSPRDSVYGPIGSSLPEPQTSQPSVSQSKVEGHTFQIQTHTNEKTCRSITKIASHALDSIKELFFKISQPIKDRIFNQTETISIIGISGTIRLPYPKTMELKDIDVNNKNLDGLLKNTLGFKALKQAVKNTFPYESRDLLPNFHLLVSINHLNSLISDNKEAEAKHVWQQMQELFFDPDSHSPFCLKTMGYNLDLLMISSKNLFSKDFTGNLKKIQNNIEDTLGQDSVIFQATTKLNEFDRIANENQKKAQDLTNLVKNDLGIGS